MDARTCPCSNRIVTPGIETINIKDEQVQRFNTLAHSMNDAMPPLTADQLAGVARRVLRTASMGGESPFIRSRLRRAAEMRRMITDAAWSMADQTSTRIRDLLAYLDDPNGLIPTNTPAIGRLDDALLVDIAMDSLRDELDSYADFDVTSRARRWREGYRWRRLDMGAIVATGAPGRAAARAPLCQSEAPRMQAAQRTSLPGVLNAATGAASANRR